jgi:hypothetical protein
MTTKSKTAKSKTTKTSKRISKTGLNTWTAYLPADPLPDLLEWTIINSRDLKLWWHWLGSDYPRIAFLLAGLPITSVWPTMSLPDRGDWLVTELWKSKDILNDDCCDKLDIPHGSTLGVAARKLKKYLPE